MTAKRALPSLPWRGTAAAAVRAFGPALVDARVRRDDRDGTIIEPGRVPGKCRIEGKRAAFDYLGGLPPSGGRSWWGVLGDDQVEVVKLNTRCCADSASGEFDHRGRLRCERRKTTRIKFENGRKDCACPTCARHSVVVQGVRLCYGCDAERTRT